MRKCVAAALLAALVVFTTGDAAVGGPPPAPKFGPNVSPISPQQTKPAVPFPTPAQLQNTPVPPKVASLISPPVVPLNGPTGLPLSAFKQPSGYYVVLAPGASPIAGPFKTQQEALASSAYKQAATLTFLGKPVQPQVVEVK